MPQPEPTNLSVGTSTTAGIVPRIFISVARFRDRFYRPDVIARVLDKLDINEAVSLADKESGRGSTSTAPIKVLLYPPTILAGRSRQAKYATANENLAITYDARSRKNDPVTGIEVWVNGGKADAQDQMLLHQVMKDVWA